MTSPVVSLGKHVARGAVWMSAARTVTRLLSTVRIIVLAAMLPRDELGLFGLSAVALQTIDLLSQTGMGAALIQRQGSIGHLMGTAWIAQIVRGFVLGSIMFVSAPYCAAFFDQPRLADMMRILAVAPVLLGAQNLGFAYLHRELRFAKVVALEGGGSLVDLIACILFALHSPTAYALVVGRIAANVFIFVASFLLERRWAPWSFSWRNFRSLYSFGFWVFLLALLSATLIRGGDIVIGKVLTTKDLAIYQVAFAMACIPIMEVMTVVCRTTFPAFSRLQHDLPRLRKAYLTVLASTSFVAALSVVGFFLFSADVTALLFKREYAPMVDILPWLAVWGACRGLGSANAVLFQAIGRPALATVVQFFMLILFAALLIPLTMAYGTYGTAAALAMMGLSAQCLRYILVSKVLEIPGREILARITIPLFAAIVPGVLAWVFQRSIDESDHLLRMLIGLLILLPTFTASAMWLDRTHRFGLSDFIQQAIPRRAAMKRT